MATERPTGAGEATTEQCVSTTKTESPRLTALAQKHSSLQSTLSTLRAERAGLASTVTLPSGLAIPTDWNEEERIAHALRAANDAIKAHIGKLHQYNEIKDIAQGLVGLIADSRGVRIGEVMDEFGVGEND